MATGMIYIIVDIYKYTSHLFTNIQVYIYTNIQVYIYTNIQVCECTNIQVCECTNIQVYVTKSIKSQRIRRVTRSSLYTKLYTRYIYIQAIYIQVHWGPGGSAHMFCIFTV